MRMGVYNQRVDLKSQKDQEGKALKDEAAGSAPTGKQAMGEFRKKVCESRKMLSR